MGSCVSHAQCRYTPAPKPKGGIVNFHIKVANTVFARWNKWIVSEYANDGLNMSINFHKVVFVHIAIYRRRFFVAAARSCFFLSSLPSQVTTLRVVRVLGGTKWKTFAEASKKKKKTATSKEAETLILMNEICSTGVRFAAGRHQKANIGQPPTLPCPLFETIPQIRGWGEREKSCSAFLETAPPCWVLNIHDGLDFGSFFWWTNYRHRRWNRFSNP